MTQSDIIKALQDMDVVTVARESGLSYPTIKKLKRGDTSTKIHKATLIALSHYIAGVSN